MVDPLTLIEHAARFSRALKGVAAPSSSNETIPYQFEKVAATRPEQPFLLYGDRRITYREANELVNVHADAYRGLGLRKGDVVALFMENRPEFYWHFLGLAKLGVIVALVNTHAVGDPLAHAIRIGSPRRIVVGSELLPSYEAIRGQLADVAVGAVDVDVDPEAPRRPALPVWQDRLTPSAVHNPPETSGHALEDTCAYMYTSGTTGAPKAALVRHRRLALAAHVWGGFVWRFRADDVVYIPLPLYHTSGLLLGTGSAISYGATVALARKFSASGFWADCRRYDATCCLYIGELCRYLLNAPPSAADRSHKVRVFSGNGLRADVWEPFQKRFGIERMVEFYGSTEGNVITINFGNVTGSVGKLLPGQALARWDEAAQDFVRDARGRLVRCKPGEPGILLGRIRAISQFAGYQDRDATERKIVRNAFTRGDAWFNTGDLLRASTKRDLYFVDRVGDTFRWKGENVSTLEVQEQIARWDAVDEVNVYGVKVEGAEGRAGMAALVLKDSVGFDPRAFKGHVDAVLPTYARPLFVRVQRALQTTGTLKLQKTELEREGFDPSIARAPLYFRHPQADEYVPLDPALYAAIVGGSIRL